VNSRSQAGVKKNRTPFFTDMLLASCFPDCVLPLTPLK